MKSKSAVGWGALAAFALGGSAWYLASSRRAPTFDDAWYLETSFRLFSALKQSPLAFAREYAGAMRIKAPLIALIPLPLYALFGSGERVALWTGPLLCAWTAWSTRRIGRRLFGAEAGDAAGALTLLLPLLYGLSRLFFVETLLAALVAATIAAALEARRGDRGDAVRLGVLCGLGLLAKSTFPVYVLVPLWRARREIAPRAGLTAAVAAGLAATWYAFNLPFVAGFAFSAGFGSIARDYSPASGLSPAAIAGWAAAVARVGPSWPLAAAGALTAACVWATARPRGFDEGGRVLLAWAAPLALFAVGVNKDPRYAAPILPAFALAVGAGLARLKGPARAACTAAVAGTALWVYSAQTFGVPAAEALTYNGVPRATAWDRAPLVDALARAATPSSTAAIALEHPDMNANTLASLAASRGFAWKTTSLGYAQASAEAAMIRLKDKGADLLVLFDGVAPGELPGFLNRSNAGVADAVASGRLRAKELERVSVAPGVTARVLRLEP